MTSAPVPSSTSNDVYDRLLGRKGDEARLEPAIRAAEKNLGQELQKAVDEAGLDLEVAFESQAPVSVDKLLAKQESGTVCSLLGAAGRDPLAYLQCDFAAAGVLSEIMLGANPELPLVPLKRAPTGLERNLIGRFATVAGKAMKNALSTPNAPEFIRIVTSADELRLGGDSEPLVGFRFKLQFGSTEAKIQLALSHRLLLQMERRANPVRKPAGSQEKPRQNKNAMAVSVPVTGSISLDAMSLFDLSLLKPGAVLPLPESSANVRLKVKGRPIYECSLGRKGTNYALCLQRPHKALNEALSGIGVPPDHENLQEPNDG